MKIFDTPPKPGIRIGHKMFFQAFLRMARAWENISVNDGHVDWSNGIPTIVIDSGGVGGGEFSGNVWVGGTKVTVPEATTTYLKVPFDGSACTWVAAMPVATMDEDAEVFDITQTSGDIHLPGNYGRTA